MRRLPVFFLLDCSESMVGENLKKMEDGVAAIVKKLRQDPHALETVYFSIISFAGIAKTIAPLVELPSFYAPKLPLGGGTSLGAALETLMGALDKSVVKTTADLKGDWQPIVYLLTDGRPTDSYESAIIRWNANYAKKTTLIAVGLGKSADLTVLKRLTENVIHFEDGKEGDFTKFINWVSASVVAQSKSVGEGVDSKQLPAIDESFMMIVKEPCADTIDESSVTLVGRCQKTHKPYIIKYDRKVKDVVTADFKVQVAHFDISGCYPLDEEYFVWSDPRGIEKKINTAELFGSPGCPHCGAHSAFAMCECGKLLCINGPGPAICPWCGSKVNFSPSSSENDEGFEIGRGRG